MKKEQMPIDAELADKILEEEYYRELTQEELNAIRTEIVNNQIDLESIEDEKKSILKDYNDRIKSMKSEIKRKSRIAYQGTEKRTGNVYYHFDHDAGVANKYNEFGEFIGSRKLLPEERQGVIREFRAIN